MFISEILDSVCNIIKYIYIYINHSQFLQLDCVTDPDD